MATRMMKFRVLAGDHIEGGKVYQKGSVVETPFDLSAAFVNKFQRIDNIVPDPLPDGDAGPESRNPRTSSPALASEGAEGKGPVENRKMLPVGKDVTAKFPQAVDQDYRVFKDGGRYFVYDADDLVTAINPAGCGKDAVDAVITEALAPS